MIQSKRETITKSQMTHDTIGSDQRERGYYHLVQCRDLIGLSKHNITIRNNVYSALTLILTCFASCLKISYKEQNYKC